jgi:chromosome segregation ATPase
MIELPTPETDDFILSQDYSPTGHQWRTFTRKLERERDEAQKELSSIHQWIDRNHPDGFIDSQTYFQNLERVVDNWYDRLDRLEVDANRFVRERDEAREAFVIATDQMVQAQCKTREALRERDEAREKYDKLRAELDQLKEEVK